MKSRLECWALAVCGLGFLIHTCLYDFISDDSFITLRYARNLNDGLGLVFNSGDRVEGFTSVLWTWLLAAIGFLHGDLLLFSRLMGVAAGLGTIVLTFLLARHLCEPSDTPVAVLAAPIILASDGSLACWAASGMETALFAMLSVWGLHATVKGRHRASAAIAGAAVLCRPEGMVLAMILGLAHTAKEIREGTRRWLGWWLICGGVTAGLFAWRWIYYGDLLPNTYYAKMGGGWMQVMRGLGYFLSCCADRESLVVVLVVLIAPVLALDRRARLVAGVAAALWLVTIVAGGDGLAMYRFSVAPLTLIAALEAALLDALDRRYLRRRLPRAAVSGLILAAGVVALAAAHAIPPRRLSQYRLYQDQKTVEVPRWTLVGRVLKAHAKEGDSLAAAPIGAVSFYSGLVARDILGLTDRHIAHRAMPNMGAGWAGHEKHDGQYILSLQPTYLLLGNIDVTSEPRDPNRFPFTPIPEREKDFYATDLITRTYEPRTVKIAPGQYLNFFQLKGQDRR